MKLLKILSIMIFAASTMMLAACGGGGGSAAPSSSVGGVAAAGLVRNGVVKAYGVSALDGTKGALLGTAITDANGNYSLGLGSYIGAVLVELEGGAGGVSKYLDEATGTDVTLPAGAVFLRAAVSAVTIGVPVTVSLTPLTELAVQRATVGGKTPPAAIMAANQIVSDLFNVDIVGIKPVAPTAAAMSAAGVTDAQRAYTLALAALSQQAGAATTTAMANVVTTMNNGINPTNIMSGATATAFTTALNTFVNGAQNATGINAASTLVTGMVSNMGKRAATLTLTVTGVTGKSVGAIDAAVNMPASLYSFATDANGELAAADVATTTGGSIVARFAAQALSIAAANGTGLADGTITCKLMIDPGFDTAAVQVGTVTYKNLNGSTVTVNGAQVTVSIQ